MDAKERIAELVQVVGRLSALIAKENDALARRNPQDVAHLQDDKVALAQLYENRMKMLKEDPQVLKALAEADRDNLRHMAERLDRLMEENERYLKTGAEAIERLFKAVAEAVARQQNSAPAYSPAGKSGAYAAVQKPLAVSVNRTL